MGKKGKVSVTQWWPEAVKTRFDELWDKRYNSCTAATIDAVCKLIKELEEA